MPLDHRREGLGRLQPLPPQRGAPLVEELPGPGLPAIAPELADRFLEQAGSVQPLVRC
jgi:hypothetical protein